MIGIGIDTGGTCTDAVAYDLTNKKILASAKSFTTHRKLEEGIRASITKLPRKLIEQAEYISLSTTLATNACVENTGGRVCLIFIGVKQKTVEETYQNYGFENTECMRFLQGDPTKKEEPDWSEFENILPSILSDYDSIAVAQIQPIENGGAYEKEVRRRIQKQKDIPVVCAYEIFKDLNVIKRGAGAYLNARLIPVVEDFFRSVRCVLKEEGIQIPFVIMRSDGSLVSEQYSRQFPVETLLCGPTASIKGGIELFHESRALVIDMGGTTSDIGIIQNGEPLLDEQGIKVGNWQTFVRGIAVDTFALGGDTRICYTSQGGRNSLYLDTRREVPISILADREPKILEELEYLCGRQNGSAMPLFEHLFLINGMPERTVPYSDREIEICRILETGPLSIRQLAKELGVDVYLLDTRRLEKEGIVQRSGLTPTDAMIVQGDYPGYSSVPAQLAMRFMAKCMGLQAADLSEEIYRLVKERLYINLVRILWTNTYGTLPKELSEFAQKAFYGGKQKDTPPLLANHFFTDAVLIGVGAPIHIFLPEVAQALHTTCQISEYAGVSNALGAMLGNVCVYETVRIKVEYTISNWDAEKEEYIVYADTSERFQDYEAAVQRASELSKMLAAKKAKDCGAKEIYERTVHVHPYHGDTNLGKVLMGAKVTACAKGRLV